MRLWRISNYSDLSGEGGRRADGRWHERDRRVIYLSEHPALALLEVLVHLEMDVEDIPTGFRLLAVDVPGDIPIEEITEENLDSHHLAWRFAPEVTRALTSSWFAEVRTALLKIPSVIVPGTSNFLLNPLHSDASRLTVSSNTKLTFDERLFNRRR
jgi:RES domain-containing protein